jgi:hypothetical protein
MPAMNRTHTLLIASAIAAAMVVAGVVAVSAAGLAGATNFLAATSPTPSPGAFKSNETAAHESSETAAHEAAENNGTFRPGGPGGPGGPGHSNEAATHESGETAAQEAAENARATATPSATQ